jgi:hypothetical protein
MPDIVMLTQKPVRVTSAIPQDLRLAVDVSAYDELDLLLHVVGFAATSLVVAIETAMQNESQDAWRPVVAYSSVSSSNVAELKNVKNFLRYLRYNVTTLSGSTPNATFTLQGMGRRWA